MVRSKKLSFAAVTGGIAVIAASSFMLMPSAKTNAQGGGGSPLSQTDISAIIDHGFQSADATASASGLRSVDAVNGPKRSTKMVVAIVGRDGKLIKVKSQPDAWVGSVDIAIAKARTAAFFSSNENALTSRIIGVLSQAHNPDGTGGAGPLWGIGNSNQVGITGSPEFRNGIITFPGGVPLYKGGVLAGGVGVSGDAVDQDEAVAFGAAAGFEPGAGVVKLGFTVPAVPPFP
jgi:uncharacterized protein GlcG (DUF336 family)